MQTAQHSFNFRGIKIVDGSYQSKKSLCDRCFHPVCSDFAATDCKDMTFALKFNRPLRGFDLPLFNTFRIGEAWSKRLMPGSIVALVDSETDKPFSYAKVISVHCGGKESMARLYGQFNHNIQALKIVDNIATVMLNRLKNASGTLIYNNSDKATVVFLETIE